MNEKPLDTPIGVAKEKYPHFAFETFATLDATHLLDHWQLAKNALGSPKSVKEASHSFTVVLRDRYQEKLMKTADGLFQIFGARGEWSMQRTAEELDELIAQDCLKLWAPRPAKTEPGQIAKPPPVPFNENEWFGNHRTAIIRHLKDADRAPLDGSCRFKLLFPPDSNLQVTSTAYIFGIRSPRHVPVRADGSPDCGTTNTLRDILSRRLSCVCRARRGRQTALSRI